MKTFTVEVAITANLSIEVEAPSEEAARKSIHEGLDLQNCGNCVEAGFNDVMLWDGTEVTGEVTDADPCEGEFKVLSVQEEV